MKVDNTAANAFATQAADWTANNIAPLSAAFEGYVKGTVGGKLSGKPPHGRLFLAGVTDFDKVARTVLREVISGFVNREGATAVAQRTGYAIAKISGHVVADRGHAIAAGYVYLEIASTITAAFEIHQNLADRPDSVEGGLKVVIGYELRITSDKFLTEAVEFGRVGMPTYSKTDPTPWEDQKTGGVEGQEGGLVHGAGKVMKGVTAASAPRLFRSVNAAQAVRFRTNPVTSNLLSKYDDKKAFAWLFDYHTKAGKDEETARRLAREDARL